MRAESQVQADVQHIDILINNVAAITVLVSLPISHGENTGSIPVGGAILRCIVPNSQKRVAGLGQLIEMRDNTIRSEFSHGDIGIAEVDGDDRDVSGAGGLDVRF